LIEFTIGDDLRLIFPYLYYHLFGVRWSNIALGD